jgi:AraC family transcriptional regulator
MLLQLVGEIMRGLTRPESAGTHERAIRSATSYIQEHADSELNVARLADAVDLSDSHFRKLFREANGRSPRAMHRSARMRRACEMLAYTNLRVTQIADALGFSTVHNFSRAFRQVTGSSPRGYRATPSSQSTPSSPAT